MLEFTVANIENIIGHKVGNRLEEEELVLSEKQVPLLDDLLIDLMKTYFFKPFKESAFYNFTHEGGLHLNEVFASAEKIFSDQGTFLNESKNLAEKLYEAIDHPAINAGEFYVAYIADVKVQGEFVDAIGIFKSESKEYFLTLEEGEDIALDAHLGMNLGKLDKGCLIFDLDKEDGYRLSIFDKTKGGAEVAQFWRNGFLNVKMREDTFYHTQNFMDVCKGFVEDVFNEEQGVERTDQVQMLNRSMKFFEDNDNFETPTFNEKVLEMPEIVDAFQDYKQEYQQKNDVNLYDEFQISDNAVKKQKKHFKSIIKLDKKFHVYVHGGHNDIEKGYDEDRGKKFYKLYYESEG